MNEPLEPQAYVQADQPDGVPPLELTGERTLPDVPAENYWYRRHLAVYEWIAERVGGMTVTDLACGEGYGSDLLATRAADVVGVDANPDAHRHAAARYRRPNLRFERDLVENVTGPRDAIVFLQTIEHIENVDSLLAAIAAAAPLAYISTPNRLTLAPQGADKSDNPWHLREYTADEFLATLEPHFATIELLGLRHAGRLRLHDWALKLGWDRVHAALRLSGPFYDRFTPSIRSDDFALGGGDLGGALDFLAICRG